MENTPPARLAYTLRALEQQFGAQAIMRAKAIIPRASGIQTGVAALDALVHELPLVEIAPLIVRLVGAGAGASAVEVTGETADDVEDAL